MEYLIKASAILIVFFTFYKLFLQKETFFQSIRIFFQIGFISALIIPLIIIPKYISVDTFSISKEILQVQPEQLTHNLTINWTQVIIFIYLIGLAFFSVRFLIQLSSLIWFIYDQDKIKQGNHYMLNTNKNIAPFSFFNFIIFNDNRYDQNELVQIITHEKVHVNQLHSIDYILSHLMTIVFWFNPISWFYHKEVQNNLEYIADEHAQYISKEKQNYQYLLLKTSLPDYQLALTNNFYNSFIKKRIDMLQKNRSKNLMQFKFALIIPVLIAFIFTFNTKVIAQQKKVKTVEIQTDYEVEIITKDYQKNEFEILKNKLASKDISLKYKGLKYNSKNEIIAINLTVKNKNGNQSSLSQNGSDPIKPIRIKINNETGAMSIGNFSEHTLHESVFFSSNDDGIHKKITIKKDGDHDMIFISGDSTKIVKNKGDGFVFYSDDDKGNVEKHVIKVKTDGNKSNIWISKDGDTTKMKNIELIEIDEDDQGEIKVTVNDSGDNTKIRKIKIIEIDEDDSGTLKMIIESEGEENKYIIKSDGDDNIHKHEENIMIFNSDGEEPLFILDGKEISKEKMEDLSSDKIESMNVLKGEMAIEEYGDKGKNGVIIIKTKK